MIETIDRLGRVIEIGDSGMDVVAYHKGRAVGAIQFDETDDGPLLWDMNVESQFRRAGIAMAMMKRAVQIHGNDFAKPSFFAVGGRHASAHQYYSEEGAAFISRCVMDGLLTHPDEHDSLSGDADE